MTTELIALVAALYGFSFGFLTALAWKLTAGPESHTEPPELHMLKGSNFDYLCEWPVEDTRLDWTEDWMARMGRG